jgi:hypothetical protein
MPAHPVAIDTQRPCPSFDPVLRRLQPESSGPTVAMRRRRLIAPAAITIIAKRNFLRHILVFAIISHLQRDIVLGHDGLQAYEYALASIVRRHRHLRDADRPSSLVHQCDIGERPADIDSDSPSHKPSSSSQSLKRPSRHAIAAFTPCSLRMRANSCFSQDGVALMSTSMSSPTASACRNPIMS